MHVYFILNQISFRITDAIFHATGDLCPAFMKINIDKLNGSFRVEYNQHHSKHMKEVRFQPVPKEVENYIVGVYS